MSELCPVAVSDNSNAAVDQPQTLQDASCLLLRQKKYCDVTFTFPNLPDRIEAHELFLKARSPVFEQIFRTRRSGNVQGKEIEIRESTPARFQKFLEFIYMDKFDVNVAGALDLLHLAQKYKIQPLTNKCEELLKTEIKVDDCVQVYETARRYGRKELVDQAGDIMVQSLAYLIENGALANAQEETVMLLLQRDDLTVKEVDLFEFILKWAKDQVTTSDGEQLVHELLRRVIPLIRYTTMSPYEFNAVVSPSGLLSAEEIISVYSYLAANEAMRDNMKIKFNVTPRNPEFEAAMNFFAGNEDASSHSASTILNPLKLCMSFQVEASKKLWSDYVLKKPAITGINVKWPSRTVTNSYLTERTLNFTVFIKECCGPLNDQNIQLRFQEDFLNCMEGDEYEFPVEPAVELISGVTYCLTVEDQSKHGDHRVYYETVNYIYSGIFSPCDLSPEARVDLGGIDLKLKGIQKDNRLSGFSYSTADFPINVIRGIKISLV